MWRVFFCAIAARSDIPVVSGAECPDRHLLDSLFYLVQLIRKGSSQPHGVNLKSFKAGSARFLYHQSMMVGNLKEEA
ncbi:MAG: hypothetical protein ACI9TB_000713 [Parasphingorhabdus sp.]